MSSTGLSQRMAKFNQAFKNILGPKRQGYTEAGTLDQPLVSSHGQSDDEYHRQHGVSRPGATPPAAGQQQYQNQGVPEGAAYGIVSGPTVPDDRDELQQLTVLARDAAEILFEMAAMQDKSPEAHDMLGKSQQIEAQLRGMIGDFKGGDEMLLSQALEAFDTLTNTTTEYRAALEGKEAAKPVAGMSESSKLQPPGSNPFQAGAYGGSSTAPIVTAPGQKPDKDDEAPLISFD